MIDRTSMLAVALGVAVLVCLASPAAADEFTGLSLKFGTPTGCITNSSYYPHKVHMVAAECSTVAGADNDYGCVKQLQYTLKQPPAVILPISFAQPTPTVAASQLVSMLSQSKFPDITVIWLVPIAVSFNPAVNTRNLQAFMSAFRTQLASSSSPNKVHEVSIFGLKDVIAGTFGESDVRAACNCSLFWYPTANLTQFVSGKTLEDFPGFNGFKQSDVNGFMMAENTCNRDTIGFFKVLNIAKSSTMVPARANWLYTALTATAAAFLLVFASGI